MPQYHLIAFLLIGWQLPCSDQADTVLRQRFQVAIKCLTHTQRLQQIQINARAVIGDASAEIGSAMARAVSQQAAGRRCRLGYIE